jgi:tetratricopeptide (TPR) repeat protein
MLALAVVSGIRLERLVDDQPSYEELLYLPNGRHLQVASLGQSALLADVVYLWAIQYYSDYRREDRYRYVEHVFGDVIAELDPQYIDAYWLGALILSVEARDLEAALRLLDKGHASNPDNWILPYLAGWECHSFGQYERASRYFKIAEEAPGAPPVVSRLAAGMVRLAGDLRAAVALWQEVLDNPGSDAESIAVAERQIRDLTIRADIRDLERAIGRFREENGRLPVNLDELRRRTDTGSGSYLEAVPLDPDGHEYRYDPKTGAVSSQAAGILGDA